VGAHVRAGISTSTATPWRNEIVSATATRRVGFAIIPTGLAAVANSDIAAEDTFLRLPERACSDRAGSES